MDPLSGLGAPINAGPDARALASQSQSRDPRAIDKAAQGFESMFLTQLLKEMRQSLEPDTLFGQDAGDVLGGMFDLFLSQHLAPAGALGIASMVKKQLEGMANNAQKKAVPSTSKGFFGTI